MRAILLCSAALALACRPAQPPASPSDPAPTSSPQATAASSVPGTPPPDAVGPLIDAVDPASLRATVDRLAAFGTRHTLSADTPDRGIAAARGWLHETFTGFEGRLQVRFDVHPHAPDGRRIDRDVDVVNVVATLPGTMPQAAHRHYYVIGHYDSRASDPMDADSDAPGANDDGSGTALVVELARVLANTKLDATVVFMATAGEEQGLLGARAHAEAAAASNIDIRAVLSNDIVGDPTAPDGTRHDGHVRVFSEGLPSWLHDDSLSKLRLLSATSDGPSRQLARYVDEVGRWHGLVVLPELVFRHDRFLRGGDHTAFNEHGFAAVRFTEVGEHYDRQHQDLRTENGRTFGDRPEHVDEQFLAGVARLNLATLVHLANAPSAPSRASIVATTLTSDTTLHWDAAPEPDVAGYEVVWRSTTDATWQHARDVGNATEVTLPLHKDDWYFGVRSYDTDGYRSPVRFFDVQRR